MEIISFYDSDRQSHWISEIRKSDWRAGAFLADLLEKGTFFDTLGEGSRVLLLTDGNELVSYCTYSKYDDIQPTDLTPWVGFVYTFPERRGHRFAGLLFEEAERIACAQGICKIYLSTNHTGLYEKYGWEYFTQLKDIDGEMSGIYVRRLSDDCAQMQK